MRKSRVLSFVLMVKTTMMMETMTAAIANVSKLLNFAVGESSPMSAVVTGSTTTIMALLTVKTLVVAKGSL